MAAAAPPSRARGGDFYLATSGDINLAIDNASPTARQDDQPHDDDMTAQGPLDGRCR